MYENIMPDFLPRIYHVDKNQGILIMEDLKNYSILRTELLNSKYYANIDKYIAQYLSNEFVYSEQKKYTLNNINALSRNKLNDIITIPLFFENPYNSKYINKYMNPDNVLFTSSHLCADELLIKRINDYKYIFLNSKECLIHGDLHSGSIFVSPNSIKVIDFEFSFLGPISFDIGTIIANFIFSWIYNYYTNSKNIKMLIWLETTINNILIYFKTYTCLFINNSLKESVTLTCIADANLDKILCDSIAFAGIELIRRTVGIAKVSELTLLSPDIRCRAERKIIKLSKAMIISPHKCYNSGVSNFIKQSFICECEDE